MNFTLLNIIVVFLLLLNVQVILTSEGDLSPFYQNCVRSCKAANCTEDGTSFTPKAIKQLDIWSILMRWNCNDECQYHCMWRTVQAFEERGYQVPKFHGKWPFIRLFGVQEPASAFASVLNLAANLYMINEIKSKFSVKSMPLVLFWHGFAAVCMNAWLWSTVFHMRDTPFTEFMDYAFALSMVMGLFVAAVFRVFHRKRKLTTAILLFTLLYYAEHVRYLYTAPRIDYEYNIKVNVFFGVTGSLIWLAWAWFQYMAGGRYVWRLVAFVILSGSALILEVFEFPPQYKHWDAHAVWHLSTAPLPLLFYRFVIDDLHYLQSRQIGKQDLKIT